MIDPGCFALLALLVGQFDAPAAEPPSQAAANRAPERRVDPALLRALAAADPPVDALRAAASALALTEPDRAHSLVVRARLAGLVSRAARAGVDRRFARAESVDLGSSTAAPLAPVGIDSDNDVRYELRATWDLSKLVFNPDEIGAHFQALRTADARREIESARDQALFRPPPAQGRAVCCRCDSYGDASVRRENAAARRGDRRPSWTR
jgi:hypothetical protein